MEFIIDFIHVGDGDAIIVWAREANVKDVVFFIDGGDAGNGQKIVDHFAKYIEPHLLPKKTIGFVNSHPHADHINGLLEVIELLNDKIRFAIYNDPVECITAEHRENIKKAYLANEDDDITHLYEEFEQIEKLNEFCEKNNVERYKAFAGANVLLGGTFEILSPSEDFYVNLVQHFSDIEFLKAVDFKKPKLAAKYPLPDELVPCKIVDEVNDTSPENLTSTVIQLTDGAGNKYILTADAGVDAFDYMEAEGFTAENVVLVQLPHHGSRRNISSEWITKFNPNFYVASAAGNEKHPRLALINCIKRNLGDCKVYSTHIDGGALSYCTDSNVFPDRGWINAVPL